MQIQKAFMELFRALIDSIGVLGKHFVVCIQLCHSHAGNITAKQHKIVYYLPICHSVQQHCNLLILACIINCFQQLHRKHLLQNVCACGLRKES